MLPIFINHLGKEAAEASWIIAFLPFPWPVFYPSLESSLRRMGSTNAFKIDSPSASGWGIKYRIKPEFYLWLIELSSPSAVYPPFPRLGHPGVSQEKPRLTIIFAKVTLAGWKTTLLNRH